METISVTASDNKTIPAYWAPAEKPLAAMLVLPALGIQAKLYRKLAQQLSATGVSTLVMEQRGHGLSTPPPSRSDTHCLDDFLQRDIPALLDWLSAQESGVPLLLAGHSLGGHLATLYSGMHPQQIAGVVHLACAFPYFRDYPGKQGNMIRLICTLMPAFSAFPGYYPGHRVGFGGRESAAMMRQWCQWASTGSFDFGDHKGLAENVADFCGPVISIAFEKDEFASSAAIDRASSPFINAQLTRITLGGKEQGEHLGHTRWARSPEGVVRAVRQWIAESFQR